VYLNLKEIMSVFLFAIFFNIYNAQMNPECIQDPANPTTSLCASTPILMDMDGIITCENQASCCDCQRIECAPQCETVTCSGIRSCINVPIDIIGGVSGAALDCSGELSCALTAVQGSSITQVDCNAIEACRDAGLSLVGGPDPMIINCGDESSCAGAIISASNVVQLNCDGFFSCQNSQITLNGNNLMLNFNGDFSLLGGTLSANNVMSLSCEALFACSSSNFNVVCLDPGCIFLCSGQQACSRSNYTVTNSFGIQCMGPNNVCSDSNFVFINNLGGEFMCTGINGCRGSSFDLLSNIESITCSGRSTCADSSITATCNENIGCDVRCQDSSACSNANITTTNVRTFECDGQSGCSGLLADITAFDNTFEINVLALGTAGNAVFNVRILNNIASIKGIGCTSTVGACVDTTFIIDASTQPNVLIVESIICSGVGACSGTTFILINAQIDAANFECVNINSCVNEVFICQDSMGNVLPMESCVIP